MARGEDPRTGPAEASFFTLETTTGSAMRTGPHHLDNKDRTGGDRTSIKTGPGGEDVVALAHAPSEERNSN